MGCLLDASGGKFACWSSDFYLLRIFARLKELLEVMASSARETITAKRSP